MDLNVTAFRLVMPTLPAADLKVMPSGASMYRDLVRDANLRSFLGGALKFSVSTDPLKWAPLGPAGKKYDNLIIHLNKQLPLISPLKLKPKIYIYSQLSPNDHSIKRPLCK